MPTADRERGGAAEPGSGAQARPRSASKIWGHRPASDHAFPLPRASLGSLRPLSSRGGPRISAVTVILPRPRTSPWQGSPNAG